MQGPLIESLVRQGVSRRTFLKYCANLRMPGRERPTCGRMSRGELRCGRRMDRTCIGSADDVQGEPLRDLLPGACHFLPSLAATCHVLAAGHAGGEATGCPEGWDVAELPLRTEEGLQVVDEATVRWFHRLGIPVHVWTVDEEPDMRMLLDLGVDGIMSDRPDRLRRVLGR